MNHDCGRKILWSVMQPKLIDITLMCRLADMMGIFICCTSKDYLYIYTRLYYTFCNQSHACEGLKVGSTLSYTVLYHFSCKSSLFPQKGGKRKCVREDSLKERKDHCFSLKGTLSKENPSSLQLNIDMKSQVKAAMSSMLKKIPNDL